MLISQDVPGKYMTQLKRNFSSKHRFDVKFTFLLCRVFHQMQIPINLWQEWCRPSRDHVNHYSCAYFQFSNAKYVSTFKIPFHCLNQCWFIVSKTPRNILQWNLIWNSKVFIKRIAFENVVCRRNFQMWNTYQNSRFFYIIWINAGPCITNVFATRRKNFSQWHRSFQRKLLSHWLKFLRHVAITLVIQGPDLLSIRPRWTYFNGILFEIQKFSFKKLHLKMPSAKLSICLGLNMFTNCYDENKQLSGK